MKGLRVENWKDFEEKREREDGLRNELNGEDMVKGKEERKELGVKTRTDDRQTRRTRKRVCKRNNKKSNQKRKERRKREFEQFRERDEECVEKNGRRNDKCERRGRL